MVEDTIDLATYTVPMPGSLIIELKQRPPDWDQVDEAADESLPASDPPSFTR